MRPASQNRDLKTEKIELQTAQNAALINLVEGFLVLKNQTEPRENDAFGIQKETVNMEKQRLLVMNGQCISQGLGADNKWHDEKIEKAGTRPAGIYNLYSATPADLAKAHDGLIVHADPRSIFQQVGKSMVKHEVEKFDKVPEIGVSRSIAYVDGKAILSASQGHGRSRGI